MDYSVIKTSGSQYLVSVGDVLELPKLGIDEGKEVVFDEVLLSKVGDKVTVGEPLVTGAKVLGTVLKNFQGEKLDIFKFKAKSRYRRKMGFRAQLTSVQIVSLDGVVKEKVKAVQPKEEVKKVVKKTVKKATK